MTGKSKTPKQQLTEKEQLEVEIAAVNKKLAPLEATDKKRKEENGGYAMKTASKRDMKIVDLQNQRYKLGLKLSKIVWAEKAAEEKRYEEEQAKLKHEEELEFNNDLLDEIAREDLMEQIQTALKKTRCTERLGKVLKMLQQQ